MAKLPSIEDLGGLAPVDSRRQVATFDVTGYAKGAAAIAEGAKNLGEGVYKAGTEIDAVKRQEKEADDSLETARATSYLNTQHLQQKNDIERATNVDVATETANAQKHVETAAEAFTDPRKKQKFIETYRDNAAAVGVYAQRRDYVIKRDAGMATDLERMNVQREALLRSNDPGAIDIATTDVHGIINGWENKGWIDRTKAVELKKTWVEDFSAGKLSTLPPPERIAALQGSFASRADRTAHGPMVEKIAAELGIDPVLAKTAMMIESGGNAMTVKGSYKGLFQLSDEKFKKYGGTDIFDPEQNARAGLLSLQDDIKAFTVKNGRAPTPTEVYLSHQQGQAGLGAHMDNPEGVAWKNIRPYYSDEAARKKGFANGDAYAKAAVWGNVPDDQKAKYPNGVEGMTSKQFTEMWKAKVEGGGTNKYAALADLIPTDKRDVMLKRAEAEITDADRAKSQKIEADKEKSALAKDSIYSRIYNNDPSLSLLKDIIDNKDLQIADKEFLRSHYDANVAKGKDKYEEGYGSGFWEAYQRVHLPSGDPNRITDKQLIYSMSGKDMPLTPEGAVKLVNDINGQASPESGRAKQLESGFFTAMRKEISGTNENAGMHDPKGDRIFQQFMVHKTKEIEDAKAAGKSVDALFDEKSPDYVGKNLKDYKRPMSEWFSDVVSDKPADKNVKVDPAKIQSLEDLKQRVSAGTVPPDQARLIAVQRGWAQSRAQAEAAAVSVSVPFRP